MAQAITAQEIFTDALGLYQQALRMLDQGDIRDAAEKAWCAAKRSTDALILSRTGTLPETTALTTIGLEDFATRHPEAESLVGRYYSRIHQLHGKCFYEGVCIPGHTERRIRETIDYIREAERLAEQR